MLPKALLILHSRISGLDEWSHHRSYLVHENLFCIVLLCSCHLFLFSASVRSIPFLSFIEPIFARNVPLVSLIFLNRSLVFPILLFSSIFLHWSLRMAFLFLLGILWNSAFRWVYLSFSPLPLAFLFFSAIYKASSDNHFAFCHLFFFGMVLVIAFCTVSQTCVRSSSDPLSIRSISWIYLSLPLYNLVIRDLI